MDKSKSLKKGRNSRVLNLTGKCKCEGTSPLSPLSSLNPLIKVDRLVVSSP